MKLVVIPRDTSSRLVCPPNVLLSGARLYARPLELKLCIVVGIELDSLHHPRYPALEPVFERLSERGKGGEMMESAHGAREAVYAVIDTISSTVSLATVSFICGLNSPARAPL